MNLVQLAALSGALIALGLVLIIARLIAAQPDLPSALGNLAPERSLVNAGPATARVTGVDRVGAWSARYLPLSIVPVPTKDLALLGVPLSQYYGQKVLYAILGLMIPPGLSLIFVFSGSSPPIGIPLIGSVVLAVLMSLIPDYNARSDAAAARVEFSRALSAYVDLVALERIGGAGPRQAMESAAVVGDSWVFTRLAEELGRSRWSGVPPWEALARLATELDLGNLNELADIMRLSGEEGSAVYSMLRARASALRAQLVTSDLAEANRASERLTLPGALLALSFAALILAPALFRLLFGAPSGVTP